MAHNPRGDLLVFCRAFVQGLLDLPKELSQARLEAFEREMQRRYNALEVVYKREFARDRAFQALNPFILLTFEPQDVGRRIQAARIIGRLGQKIASQFQRERSVLKSYVRQMKQRRDA